MVRNQKIKGTFILGPNAYISIDKQSNETEILPFIKNGWRYFSFS